jgi:hypothetical protein
MEVAEVFRDEGRAEKIWVRPLESSSAIEESGAMFCHFPLCEGLTLSSMTSNGE